MRWATVIGTSTLVLWSASLGAQSAPASTGLQDLDAMTFSCARSALNAAARAAAKVSAQGTYQFVFFKTLTGSHHARFEVHFKSNYEGEPDLKYCVMLYCQQGWDPAAAQPSVTLMTATPRGSAAASTMGSCTDELSGGTKSSKHKAN
jgi:hypothetical protein